MSPGCTLVAEPDPARRSWLAAGLGPRAGEVIAVAQGWEALDYLAEHRWRLVVVGPNVHHPPPASFAAMIRTAGLGTPVLLVLPLACVRTARTAQRLPAVEVVDDWTNGVALRRGCEALLRTRAAAEHPPSAGERLRAAARRGRARAMKAE